MADSTIIKTLNGYEICDAISRGLETIATAGDGTAYTATVNGITSLTAGVNFIIVPNTTSTIVNPTLNINGLGAKYIKRRLSSGTSSTAYDDKVDWLVAGQPINVMYDGTSWIADLTIPDANSLYGTIPLDNLDLGELKTALEIVDTEQGVVPVGAGGTGANTAAGALKNLGLTVSASELNNVMTDIDGKSDFLPSYKVDSSETATYYKLFTIDMKNVDTYRDIVYDIDIAIRQDHIMKLHVYIKTNNSQEIFNANIWYEDNDNAATLITGYVFTDDNDVSTFELWGKVPSWDGWYIYDKTLRNNVNFANITWNLTKESALPTNYSTSVTPVPKSWCGEAKTAKSLSSESTYVVPIKNGGTNATTRVNAFNNLTLAGTVNETINTDWNAITDSGVYRVEGFSGDGSPTGVYEYGQLFVIKANNAITQMYISHHHEIMVRQSWNGGGEDTSIYWTTWSKVATNISSGTSEPPSSGTAGSVYIRYSE